MAGQQTQSPPLAPGVVVGCATTACDVVTRDGGGAWVALFGACSEARRVSRRARRLVSEQLDRAFSDAGAEVEDELLAVGLEVDGGLREAFSPIDPDGCGTLILARVEPGSAWIARTPGGSAYVVRGGRVVWELEGPRGGVGRVEVDPHVGGRPRDAADVVLDRPDPVALGPGDWLILCTCPLSRVVPVDRLASLTADEPPEALAQTLQAMAELVDIELGVAVAHVAPTDGAEELQAADEEFSDVLSSLEDVLPALIANETSSPTPGLADDALPATDGFAPVRAHFPIDDGPTLVPPETAEPPLVRHAERPSLPETPADPPAARSWVDGLPGPLRGLVRFFSNLFGTTPTGDPP